MKGATRRPPGAGQQDTRFNPRPREGGDAVKDEINTILGFVSIHAPVKGATRK